MDGLQVKLLTGSKHGKIGEVIILSYEVAVEEIAAGLAVKFTNIQTARVTYTWTAQNVIDGFATVPILFPTPFLDTAYTLVWSPDDMDDVVGLDYYNGDIHAKAPSGFNAIVYAYSPGPDYSHAGDVVVVNAIAIHD